MSDRELVTTHELALREPIPADRHPAAVYLASLAKGSLPAQRSALNKIAEIVGLPDAGAMDWGALRYQHVQFIRARLMERYAAPTGNRLLTALRRVLKEAWRLGYISGEEYYTLRDIDPIRGEGGDTEDDLMGRALSAGELLAIMNVCTSDKTIAGARDAAIIALGYALGLRRAEISKMQLAHYNAETAKIKVKSGKGNKSRTLPIANGAKDALDDWLKVRGNDPGAMFLGINKGGHLSSNALGPRAIDELFNKRAGQANVDDAHFHDLRRSMISDLLDKGVDVVTVAKLAGHSDPMTTKRYDRRTMDNRRKAIQVLHVPYRRKDTKTKTRSKLS